MANKDSHSDDLRSLSGQAEPPEVATNGANTAATGKGATATKTQPSSQSSISSAPLPTLRKSSSANLTPQVSSPLAQSPLTSRNTSPVRKDKPPVSSAHLSIQPSAAAIQRALSASNVPQLQQQASSAAEATSKLPRASRGPTQSGETTPQWPMSPRLKSPPPSGPNSRRGSAAAQKKSDTSTAPSVQVAATTSQGTSHTQSSREAAVDSQKVEPQLQPPPPPKTSGRGPSGKSMLETVQENSADSQDPSPAALQAAADLRPLTKLTDEDRSPRRDASQADEPKPAESGSESAGNKSDSADQRGRRQSANNSTNSNQPQRARNPSLKNSYSLASVKSRPGDSKQNMTVETEIVQSIPQSGLAPANEGSNRLRLENGGTVKLKPSSETIRPKKERKKAERKARSVNQGTATSKADLFEARVANAVDEANTSDSDETFVYESNPPELHRRQRHHSRTPSVTSSHSIAEQQRGVVRNFGGDPFDDRRVGGKRSMKFSSNPYNDVDSPESKDGTVRSHTPRHIGRFGRGGHHSASYDTQDSPFTQASKLRQHQLQRSRPTSPKSPHSTQFRPASFFSRKHENSYDFDTEQNADDERTPLMGTVRQTRTRGARRIGTQMAYPPEDYVGPSPGRWQYCCGVLSSCFITGMMVLLIIISAILFIVASNRTLYDVQVDEIQNVLASEHELMMDLLVGAVNPNVWAITITDLDVDVFAKSKYVDLGDKNPIETTAIEGKRRKRSSSLDNDETPPNSAQDLSAYWHAPDDQKPNSGVEREALTMQLGRVFSFDQSISFDGTPFKQKLDFKSGQVRLMKPGNKTEAGGSALWEKVILHPFELIVRGVLIYQLPISARPQSIAVGASVVVHPEDGIDKFGNMRTEPVNHKDHWQWIDWDDIMREDRREKGGRVAELD